jgi:LPS O-antigen subunit length determinant protein (WzzB/FepE family)
MELKAYLQILWRRKWTIVVTVLVTTAVVVTGTLLTTPTYSASTTLRVATAAGGSVDYTTYQYAERLGSSHMTNLLEQLRRGFDMVLIDTPASKALPILLCGSFCLRM